MIKQISKVKLELTKYDKKRDINEKTISVIKNLFTNFLLNIQNFLSEELNFNQKNVNEEINSLKADYENAFYKNDFKLQFIYEPEIYKIKNKIEKNFITLKQLEKNNYKIIRESDLSDKRKIQFVIVQELRKIFSKIDNYIEIDQQDTNLTFKQLYNYNYFIDSQPRCCFCGQLLEHSTKNNKEYIHADIEHLLPEFEFPQFILHPLNWAPCCKECNMGEKRTKFFEKESPQEDFEYFIQAIKEVATDFNNVHPLKLWQNIRVEYDTNDTNNDNIYYISSSEALNDLMNLYGIKKRAGLILNRCYNNLFNIIENADIRSPESLEKLLENIASSNWHEINDGYSLNNSPQIWQESIENILYDECKLMALWDEIKSSELRFL